MQSSGSSHQSHRLSEQHGEQPRDEGEIGKIHGGKRTVLFFRRSVFARLPQTLLVGGA